MRIIARFGKSGALRYISHLDTQRLFQRCILRAGVPVALSRGFNPHPVLSFALALPLGWESEGEYADFALAAEIPPEEFKNAMNAAMPRGIRLTEAILVNDSAPSLTSTVAMAEYKVLIYSKKGIQSNIDSFFSAKTVPAKKMGKGGEREIDLRPLVYSIVSSGNNLVLKVAASSSASAPLPLVLERITEAKNCGQITRLQLYAEHNGGFVPLIEYFNLIEGVIG